MSEPTEKSAQSLIEEEMLAKWAEEKTFEQSLEKNRESGEYFSFYDGPPFANGLPHFGHSLGTSIKDSILRYKTMRGYYAPRRNGWDCHGLPVEYAIEKQFGVSGKKQISELGLDKFNAACRASIFEYKGEWEVLLQRLGRWSEYENYYATVDSSYTESVWWALKQVNDKKLLYRDYKSTPYCPRCETPLSNFEVNDGYKDNVPDPSLYVKFKLSGEDAFLLAWTTTPWSLPGNAAIAVNPEAQYVYVSDTDDDGKPEVLVLAKERLDALKGDDYRIEKEVKGSELVGKSYEPVFAIDDVTQYSGHEKLYRVWPADFVSIEDGTGVLHVAPAFGEDDLKLGQEQGLPVIPTVAANGHLADGFGLDEVHDVFFKEADLPIIEHLTKHGSVYAAETAEHTYPFCWRCETPLMYYAITSWFIRVSGIRDDLQKTAADINWTPGHIKDGRFGKWLEGARDWAISRNRYWGAPMPIWVNTEDADDYLVVGSFEELKELAGETMIDTSDVHRPMIDDVVIERDGKIYKRVEEVLDCWFESGCMSIGQQHYPFENKESFEKSFPADFITEGLDQTRLWFYVQHVMNTILFDKPAYKNVVVNGMIMAADGQKLSKRLRNYPPVEDVFNTEGADSLRLYMLSQNQATETADYMRFNRDAMVDVNRNVLGRLMNSYKFFTMYADVDGWQPSAELLVPGARSPEPNNVLDTWILARLNATIAEVTKQADNYKIAHSLAPIFELIDDTSNWYIRRSRRRFWKSDDDGDKTAAYETLWFVLVAICQLLAPFAPFTSDYLWRELTKGTGLPASVHLSDWPANSKIDSEALNAMSAAREYINEGLSQRAAAGLKVRQPLSSVTVPELPVSYQAIVAEELNVKQVKIGEAVKLDVALTPELEREGMMRDVVRSVQNARKQAGLQVDDRIVLHLAADDQELTKAITEHAETIKSETLAVSLDQDADDTATTIKVAGTELSISLAKA